MFIFFAQKQQETRQSIVHFLHKLFYTALYLLHYIHFFRFSKILYFVYSSSLFLLYEFDTLSDTDIVYYYICTASHLAFIRITVLIRFISLLIDLHCFFLFFFIISIFLCLCIFFIYLIIHSIILI